MPRKTPEQEADFIERVAARIRDDIDNYEGSTFRRIIQARPMLNGKAMMVLITSMIAISGLSTAAIIWGMTYLKDDIHENRASINKTIERVEALEKR